MQRIVLPLLACAATVLTLPLFFMVAEAMVQGDSIGRDDLEFGYSIVAPFALLVSLAIVWPVWAWQQGGHGPAHRRMAIVVIASIVLPMVLMLPLAGELPWKAGVAGLGTLLIWLCANYIGRMALIRTHHIRSNPSG